MLEFAELLAVAIERSGSKALPILKAGEVIDSTTKQS